MFLFLILDIFLLCTLYAYKAIHAPMLCTMNMLCLSYMILLCCFFLRYINLILNEMIYIRDIAFLKPFTENPYQTLYVPQM